MSAPATVLFTRRITLQCRRPGARVPDWVVCDTLLNGDRRILEARGPGGGRLAWFWRGYGRRGTLFVLGERLRGGLVAHRLARRGPAPKKSRRARDF